MIAGYHKKLPADLMQDMDKARQESEQWAATEYAQALAKGDAITPEERQKVIDQMARYTGLEQRSARPGQPAHRRAEIYSLSVARSETARRPPGRAFHRPDPNGLLDTPFYDPTESAILPPFTSAFNNYVRTELGYKTDMPYQVFPADQNFFEKPGTGAPASPDFPIRPLLCARRS